MDDEVNLEMKARIQAEIEWTKSPKRPFTFQKFLE